MRKFTTMIRGAWVCVALGVLSAASANAMDGSGLRERSFHNGNPAVVRSGLSGHERSERFHHRFHDRDFAYVYPDYYAYYPERVYSPGPYAYCSSSYQPGYPPIGAIFVTLPDGSSALVLNNVTYYTHDGVYFLATPQGYVVVPPLC